MLPSPLMNFWSIISCFILPSSSVDATNISPNVLGSTNRRSPPCWKVTITWVWGARATLPFARMNRPLIPKCTTQTSPPSRVSRMYFPRRSVFMTLCPARRDENSFRVLWRRITRIAFFEPLTSTSLIFLPTTSRSRSRRITSTSGSSINAPPHRSIGASLRDARVGLASSLLLGFLLRAPDARPQRLSGDHDGRRELLLVVGVPCHVGERRNVHDGGAELRELTFGHRGIHPVREIGHDQAQNRVAEELQPFVRDGEVVLERERSVSEGCLPQLGVAEGNAERAIECLEPMFDGRLAHAATRPRPLDGRRSSRSSRRRGAEASVVCIAGTRCRPALRPSRWHGVSRSASCSAS